MAVAQAIATKVDANDVIGLIATGSEGASRETAANKLILQANYLLIGYYLAAGGQVPEVSIEDPNGLRRWGIGLLASTTSAPSQGSITLSANPADTNTITIDDDDVGSKVYEFDSGGGITGDVAVTIGADVAATCKNLIAAIVGTQNIHAFMGPVAGTIWLVNGKCGAANDTITKVGANIAVTGFVSGVA